jgi:hypothetical protein
MTKTRFMQGLCVGLSLLIGGTQMTAQDNVVTTGIPKIQFVTVEPGVNLEVLDWGGSGRALVLLAGLGRDAHAFKKFAPKLADSTTSMELRAEAMELLTCRRLRRIITQRIDWRMMY